MKKLIVFELENVLFNAEAIDIRVINNTLIALGINRLGNLEVSGHMGESFDKRCESLLDRQHMDLKEDFVKYAAKFEEFEIEYSGELFPEILAMLYALKERDCILCICSERDKEYVDHVCRKFGFYDIFNDILDSGSLRKKVEELACLKNKYDTEKFILIGIQKDYIELARQNNGIFIAAAFGYSGAEVNSAKYIANNAEEIPGLVDIIFKSHADSDSDYLQKIKLKNILPGLFTYIDDIAFFLKDRDGKIMFANPTLLKTYNLKDESDIIGKTDYDILERYLADKYRIDDLRILETGQPSLNMIELVLSESGVPDWYTTNKVPVFSNQNEIIGIMGTIRRLSGQVNNNFDNDDNFIYNALQYIAMRVADGITVKSISQHFGLSVRGFEKKFAKYLNISPKAFITKYKVSKSCDYLLKNGNISQAAIDCGFYDQSSFTAQFKKIMGVTPHQYIQNMSKRKNK